MFAISTPSVPLAIALVVGGLLSVGIWWLRRPKIVSSREPIFVAAGEGLIDTLAFFCYCRVRVLDNHLPCVVTTTVMTGMDGRRKRLRHTETKNYHPDSTTAVEALEEIDALAVYGLARITEDVYACYLRRKAPHIMLTLMGFGDYDGQYTDPVVINNLVPPLADETMELPPVQVPDPASADSAEPSAT